MKPSLVAGLSHTMRWPIDRERTIDFMGEALRVYATPWMIRDIEETSRQLVLPHLEEGEDTVGAHISADHMGATLLDMWVDITTTITEVEGRRIALEVEVRDALDVVAKAKHLRFVIDMARQKERLEKKAAAAREQGGG